MSSRERKHEHRLSRQNPVVDPAIERVKPVAEDAVEVPVEDDSSEPQRLSLFED